MIKINGVKKDPFGNIMQMASSENPEDFKCSRCHKMLNEGYLCRERELILCNDCEAKMWEQPVLLNGSKGESEVLKCSHDIENTHYHTKWFKSTEE